MRGPNRGTAATLSQGNINFEDDGTYTAEDMGKQALPKAYYALESRKHHTFDSRSEVWMFGVCVWEIFKACVDLEATRELTVDRLEQGERLPQPSDCPGPVCGMQACTVTAAAPMLMLCACGQFALTLCDAHTYARLLSLARFHTHTHPHPHIHTYS